jgi:hypothetical protein
MANKYLGPKSLTLAQQIYWMKAYYPHFRLATGHGVATWIGSITPSALSETYQVKIVYKLNKTPEVTVLSPQLRNHTNGKPIPHVYPGNHPCVYLPESGEWHPGKFIAETIVPWISLWLYHYEIWHITGEWLGGGVHPNKKQKRGKKSR